MSLNKALKDDKIVASVDITSFDKNCATTGKQGDGYGNKKGYPKRVFEQPYCVYRSRLEHDRQFEYAIFGACFDGRVVQVGDLLGHR